MCLSLTFLEDGASYVGLDAQLNASIQAAVVNAIFDSPATNSWTCPSNSSCTWETFATLGVCSECTNVTSETEQDCPAPGSAEENKAMIDWQSGTVCNYTTPSNFTLQSHVFTANPQISFMTRINTTARTGSKDGEISGFATLRLDWDGSLDIHECSLLWCAKIFPDATAQGPSFSVQVDDYHLKATGDYEGPSGSGYSVYEAQDGFPTLLNTTFTIQYYNGQALSSFLVNALNTGSFTEYLYQDGGSSNTFTLALAMMNNPSTPYMADNIATSLTNTIRNLTTDYITHNPGDSIVQIQYIQVRWEWLALPATIVLLGILLLLTTMIQSHREKALVWKCSSLALLFHPLQGWESRDLSDISKREMKKCAKGMRGQLSQSDDVGLRIIKA